MKTYLAYYVLIVALFSFCKKDNKTEPAAQNIRPEKTIYVSNELKEWAYFNIGSYWIYKDSINNTLDSVYVYKITSAFKTQLALDTNRIYEEITIWFGGYSAVMDWILSGNTIRRVVGVNNVMQIFNLDTTLTVNLPAYGTNKNYSISNFSVLNTNYGNVRCFAFKYLFFNPHQTNFDVYETNYWKKNIGIVKSLYGQPNSSIRKLLRYHVTQ